MFDQSDLVYDRWKDALYDLDAATFLARYGMTKHESVAQVTTKTGDSDADERRAS